MIAANDFYFSPANKHHSQEPAVPTPGSVEISLSTISLNNILQLAAPLAANEIFHNATFDLDYQKKGFLGLYNFRVDRIHTNEVDGFDIKDFSFKEGTNTVVLTVGGVNIDAEMEGVASCMWLIKGHFQSFTIKNLTMRVEIAIDTMPDGVHYKVLQTTDVHIEDFTLTMRERVWNNLVRDTYDVLLVSVNTLMNRFIPHKIDKKVNEYNKKLQ